MIGSVIRSILSIILGFITISITMLIRIIELDPRLRSSPRYPGELSIGHLLSVAACLFIGGFITALVAKRSERLHALALGIVILVLDIANIVTPFNPHQDDYEKLFRLFVEITTVEMGGYLMAILRKKV